MKIAKVVGMDQITCKNCNNSSWMQVTKILLTHDRPEQFPSFLVRSGHSTYSLQIKKRRTSIALSYFGILLPLKILKAPSQWSEWYGVTCKKSGKISSTKKTKQQRKFLIYIQKLLKINISFITSNHFSRLCPFVFVKPRSKHKYQCFLILVQSFSAYTFSRIYALIVSDTNFHQFGHAFSF